HGRRRSADAEFRTEARGAKSAQSGRSGARVPPLLSIRSCDRQIVTALAERVAIGPPPAGLGKRETQTTGTDIVISGLMVTCCCVFPHVVDMKNTVARHRGGGSSCSIAVSQSRTSSLAEAGRRSVASGGAFCRESRSSRIAPRHRPP